MKPEAMKKLTDEIREKLLEKFASPAMQETIASTRAASDEDTGTFEVIISTADVDRQGESIKLDAWDFSFFMANPVVLYGHNYYDLPIGVCDEIGPKDGKIVAKGRFAPADANPFAQQVRKLYDAGMMRTTSVGFIAREMEGSTITKAELLEFSFVPVPANPYAVSLRQISELGIDREALSFKGIQIEVTGCKGLGVCEDGECDHNDAKGAVAEEIAEADAWEMKWKNLDGFFDIIDAFLDAYLDDAVDPDQFNTLLKETVDLLGVLAGDTGTTEASLNTGTVKSLVGTAKKHFSRKSEEVAGTETPSTDAAPEGEEVAEETTAVGEIPGGSEGEEQPDGAAPETRSRTAMPDSVRDFKQWQDQKAVLRLIATITSDALGNLNAKERAARD